MAAELTGSQDQLLRGPAWSGCSKLDIGRPLAGRFNIAARSTKTTNKRLALETSFSTKAVIQEAAITALEKLSRKRVWLKLDATDIKTSLQESQRGEWNGDIDIPVDGLADLREEYDSRRAAGRLLVAANLNVRLAAIRDVRDSVRHDLVILAAGLTEAIHTYQACMAVANTSIPKLTAAAWNVADYNILHQQAAAFIQTFDQLEATLIAGRQIEYNGTVYLDFLRSLFKKKRTAADHLMVILVSCEYRRTKPYCVPVQYIPYTSIRDQQIRDLTAGVKQRLMDAGIIVVGTVTDGEFCSLRSLGDTRPLHVWQLVKDSRLAVSKMSKDVLESMLFPTGDVDGAPIVDKPHPAIDVETLRRSLHLTTVDGMTRYQVVETMRRALIPAGFQPCTWRVDCPESHLDRLRTFVATLMFRHVVAEWRTIGVDFSRHLYVPEIDKITNEVHHERADHGHLLKRIADHTRNLRYQALRQQPFVDAMLDRTTGLTHAALNGLRKQSVVDAERLLSHQVADFFYAQNHLVEAEYVNVIAQWHEASDGRGLTEEVRSLYNMDMVNYLVQDWMPWSDLANKDYSRIDINRRMDDIRGFSRETFVEITTNIESQEYRRRDNTNLGPEHPRASTTDDNEAFFAICHRYLGGVFTLQDFKHRWQKIVKEFCKKMDPTLPFYYKTANERYKEEDEEDFNADPAAPTRLHLLVVNRREDASVFAANRVHLPQRHAQSIRQKFHAIASEADLPPVPEHMLPTM